VRLGKRYAPTKFQGMEQVLRTVHRPHRPPQAGAGAAGHIFSVVLIVRNSCGASLADSRQLRLQASSLISVSERSTQNRMCISRYIVAVVSCSWGGP
jgi:hypothetical protein